MNGRRPYHPVYGWSALAAREGIGAEASFVARAIDTDKNELTEVLRAAAAHKGSALVEIYQNCNIYDDGAFDFVREEKENRLYLRHGEPIVWGDKGRAAAAGRVAGGRGCF